MLAILINLTPWHWLSIAVAMLIFEMFSGTVYLLWISFSATITALLLWMFDMSWEAQVGLFTIISILSVIGWHQYDKKRDKKSSRPTLNKRGHQYIGRTFQLIQPIVNGAGKINVDDSSWKVRGQDAPIDTKVKVTDIDGTVLIVETLGEKE